VVIGIEIADRAEACVKAERTAQPEPGTNAL
jgi:hypothetical protein